MNPKALWDRYAAIWSIDPVRRDAELDACVQADCTYCDPNGLLEGRAALAAYMEAFRRSAPGARFKIIAAYEHHGRSVSMWELQSSDGSALQAGTSFAVHGDRGRLQHITGFFPVAAPSE
jgi:hypothetical protein